MVLVSLTKRMEIIVSIQVSPIPLMSINCKDTVERKAFPAKPKYQHRVSQCGEDDCSAHNKRMEIVTSKFDLFHG